MSIGVRLWSIDEHKGKILGGALYIRCEVSRLAACDASPDAGPWPNSAKVTPDDARDLLATLLLCLEHAVGAGDLLALPCEVTRMDAFVDARVSDVRAAVAACAASPIVSGRAPLAPILYGRTGIAHPRTAGRSLEGGRTSPRTQATRVYSRGDKPGAPHADAGIVRYEVEHGTGAHGSAATPIEYDPPEHLPDLPVRPVSKWTTREGEVSEALSLETALDPALWTGILAARLLEQGLTPGLRPGGEDLAAFANALIRDGIRPDQASFYAMIASGRLNVSDRTARATRRRVESKTSLRWGAAAEESFPEKVWQLLKEAKANLKETKLSEAKLRKNLAQILALDPEVCAHAQVRRELEREIASFLEGMPGGEDIARATREVLCMQDEDPQDSPTRCLLPALREEDTEAEEGEQGEEERQGPAVDHLEPSPLTCSSDLLNPYDLRKERTFHQGESGEGIQEEESSGGLHSTLSHTHYVAD